MTRKNSEIFLENFAFLTRFSSNLMLFEKNSELQKIWGFCGVFFPIWGILGMVMNHEAKFEDSMRSALLWH